MIQILGTLLVVILIALGITRQMEMLIETWTEEGIIPLIDILFILGMLVAGIAMIYAIYTYIP